MDIGVWLRSLSLEQYEAAFRENAIDADVLHDLTEQDLEKLGVLLGHRRKLLRAIDALDGTVAASSALAPLQVNPPYAGVFPLPKPPATPAPETAGDRRHVTVMFCDLVNSTGIAAKLDAEEWRDLLGTYVDGASAAVSEMGGKIVRKQGDGLMVLFGYPVALENDAERAARAALAIQRSLAELNRKNAGSGKARACRAHCDRVGAGAGRGKRAFRRRAQHRGPRAGGGRAGRGRGHGARAGADRRSVCCRGARQSRIQRRTGAGDLVPPGTGERCPTPRGATPSHAADRS